jgi:hypothetical protein
MSVENPRLAATLYVALVEEGVVERRPDLDEGLIGTALAVPKALFDLSIQLFKGRDPRLYIERVRDFLGPKRVSATLYVSALVNIAGTLSRVAKLHASTAHQEDDLSTAVLLGERATRLYKLAMDFLASVEKHAGVESGEALYRMEAAAKALEDEITHVLQIFHNSYGKEFNSTFLGQFWEILPDFKAPKLTLARNLTWGPLVNTLKRGLSLSWKYTGRAIGFGRPKPQPPEILVPKLGAFRPART